MIVIDGSYGEGGGQILRTSIALSSLLKIPIKIYNIRKKRKNPGLKPQHFTAVKALKEITSANVKGLEIGSTELIFEPKFIEGGKYVFDIKTAGSIPLFFQCTILPLLFASKIVEIYIKGGTDVKNSPTIDYLRFVIIPYLRKFAEINLEIKRRGFYPRGGGIVYLRIKPLLKRDKYESSEKFLEEVRKRFKRLNLIERADLREIYIYACASEDLSNRKVCEREIKVAEKILKEKYDCNIISTFFYDKTLSTGNSITIVGIRENGIIFGADAIGEKKKRAEDVAREVSQKFIKYEENGAIDNHLADNLIPYLSLVGGMINTDSFTSHLLTNIWVSERFFGKIFFIDEKSRIIKTNF